MKKIFLWVAVAMLGMLATSCNKEDLQDLTQTHIILNALYPSSDAKVAYTECGNVVSATWQEGDTILLCYNGTVNKLHLTAGAGGASATFEGDIAGSPDEGAMMVCYVKDCNATDGAVTVSGDGSYLYSSSAFLSQDGTLASAAKVNLYCGWARYSGGSDIQCDFTVNTALLKFTIHAPYDDASAGDIGTLHYESDGTELACATFTIGEGKSNVVWMSVPAGQYSGVQKLVYEISGSGFDSFILSATHANFVAGQVYSKGIVFGTTTVVTLSGSIGDTIISDGQVLTGTGGEYTHVTIADGATVTLHDVDITKTSQNDYCPGIACEGDATIILSGTNKLKGYGSYSSGLFVPENKTLTIRGGGSLTATGGSNAPGIGSWKNNSCGNIVIEDGTVTAIGDGSNNPGIGSKYDLSCGDINISGGTVTATGKSAGIGGGGSSSSSSCGNILISGGKVVAKAEGNGVGIGNNYGTCGTITITGGDVTATGNKGGIGAGGGSSSSYCGNILISGGKVTAKAEGTSNVDGCGIGGKCGTITITGGTVTATAGGSGTAGIGSKQNTPCSDITISGGTVVATGGYNAPGIGSGISGGSCGDILINGGTVTAIGGDGAVAIGSSNYNGSCQDITITDGVVHVTATKGPLDQWGEGVDHSIGAGTNGSTCGTIYLPTDPSKLTQN